MSDKTILLLLELAKAIINIIVCVGTYYLLNSIESEHQLLVVIGTMMTAFYISIHDMIRKK